MYVNKIKKSFVLYEHISPNGKRYIGVTSKSPENRWCNGLGYSYNKYFYSAIKKYGWDNFKHNIIKENLSYEEAANLEREYIEKYDTINPKKGYNHSIGGEGISNYCLTEEQKKKISEATKKAMQNPEVKEKISKLTKKALNKEEIKKKLKERTKPYSYRKKVDLMANENDLDNLVKKFVNEISDEDKQRFAELAGEALKNNENKMQEVANSFVDQDKTKNQENNEADENELILYKSIPVQKVDSSNIEGLAYLSESKVLKIRFSGGGEYVYKNVEELQYKNIMNAKSIGKYFNDNIKAFPDKYKFIRL